MPRRILDTSKINKTRLELINKGYLTRSEIAKFVPCGSVKASQIYHEIRSQVEAEGLENCFNVILVGRLLAFMGLTTKEVREAAKREISWKGGVVNGRFSKEARGFKYSKWDIVQWLDGNQVQNWQVFFWPIKQIWKTA